MDGWGYILGRPHRALLGHSKNQPELRFCSSFRCYPGMQESLNLPPSISFYHPSSPPPLSQSYLGSHSESVSPSVMFDSVTPWTIPCQAPLSLEFSRQEYWSGNPFPSPGGLPNPGTEPGSPTLQADYLVFESPGKPSTSLL